MTRTKSDLREGLSILWDRLDSPIFRVVAEAEKYFVRQTASAWLYADRIDGYMILSHDDVMWLMLELAS